MIMRIPASFKIGILEFKVKLVDKISFASNSLISFDTKKVSVKSKVFSDSSMTYGICDPTSQTIWIATKDLDGVPMSKERLESTFYHELAHAFVGETANNEANRDEVFIEALGKNIYSFMATVSDEEAVEYDEEEDTEIEIEIVKEVKPSKKSKK